MLFTSLTAILFLITSASPQPDAENKQQNLTIIAVPDNEWTPEVSACIVSATQQASIELWRHFSYNAPHAISLERNKTENIPRTLEQRGPASEHMVLLSINGREKTDPYKIIYQFSHELLHVMAARKTSKTTDVHSECCKWIEEAFAEAASLFVLRKMDNSWTWDEKCWPFYSQLKKSFASYAQEYIQEPHRKLPEGVSLEAWYNQKACELRKQSYTDPSRDNIEVVANILLESLETNPENWEIAGYLDTETTSNAKTFKDFLMAWQADVPDEYKWLVGSIMKDFGLGDPSKASVDSFCP